MKKVYVLLAALMMSATMLVQAAPLANNSVKANPVAATFSVNETQQMHHPVRHRRHHRHHRRPARKVVVVHH